MSKKALILTWEKYQDHEVIYPYYRVQEDDFEVDIMTNILGRVHGYLGTYNESTKLVSDFDDQKKYDSYMNDYGLLIIPWRKSIEYLRQQTNALKFISEWNEGKSNWLHMSWSSTFDISKNNERKRCVRLLLH